MIEPGDQEQPTMTNAEDDPQPVILDLPVDQSMALAALRARVAGAVADLDEEHRQVVLLVLTELVTNVHDHAPGPGRLRVGRTRASDGTDGIRVEVDDAWPDLPVIGRSRLGADRGRGWVLISSLSHTWGAQPLPTGGKTVWAVIPCDNSFSDRV